MSTYQGTPMRVGGVAEKARPEADMTEGLRTITREVEDLLAVGVDRPSTEVIDDYAQRVLDGIDRGEINEQEGRRLLSSLAFASDIHNEVASRLRMKTRQARSDIADSLAELTMHKILSDASGGYDVVLARGRSLCGYARNLQSAALRSKNRDFNRRDRHLSESDIAWLDAPPTSGAVFERLGLAETTESAEEQFIHDAEAEEEEPTLSVGQDETASLLRVNISREERIFYVAQKVVESLGVPFPLRPYVPDDRAWLDSLFRQYPAAARQSLKHYRDLVSGELIGSVDERALSIWDNYSEDDALTLMREASSEQVAALALSSAVDLVRPSKVGRTRMLRSLLFGQRVTTPWGRIVRELVDSFLAREASVSNPHYVYREANSQELVEQRRRESEEWEPNLSRAIAFPGHPLGTDGLEVFERLVAAWRAARSNG